MTVLLVALGAAVGAPLRYLADRAVQARHDSVFPWGTLAVNVVGSFLLGALAGGAARSDLAALLGTGFCGALTTYSTFGYETLKLAESGAKAYAVLNAAVSVTLGLLAAAGGYALFS
ncbi:fluoride efflux transporter CrcB [Catellatospora sp. KI3]|uniref:fluoride efflux transporter CrcB n=1 Tax=Catellatospora sp. KI3 TaxID=3041620 RepID=UPI0024831259|nr:fluoride efflux transporter CrcB [Catellatospora sp. KI3]MDI1461694.1 fluoride efflux transporter CrcB [Catellatospora sp. KI3]